jgi:hypothetical protein
MLKYVQDAAGWWTYLANVLLQDCEKATLIFRWWCWKLGPIRVSQVINPGRYNLRGLVDSKICVNTAVVIGVVVLEHAGSVNSGGCLTWLFFMHARRRRVIGVEVEFFCSVLSIEPFEFAVACDRCCIGSPVGVGVFEGGKWRAWTCRTRGVRGFLCNSIWQATWRSREWLLHHLGEGGMLGLESIDGFTEILIQDSILVLSREV